MAEGGFTQDEIAEMFGIPAGILGESDGSITEEYLAWGKVLAKKRELITRYLWKSLK